MEWGALKRDGNQINRTFQFWLTDNDCPRMSGWEGFWGHTWVHENCLSLEVKEEWTALYYVPHMPTLPLVIWPQLNQVKKRFLLIICAQPIQTDPTRSRENVTQSHLFTSAFLDTVPFCSGKICTPLSGQKCKVTKAVNSPSFSTLALLTLTRGICLHTHGYTPVPGPGKDPVNICWIHVPFRSPGFRAHAIPQCHHGLWVRRNPTSATLLVWMSLDKSPSLLKPISLLVKWHVRGLNTINHLKYQHTISNIIQ